MSSEYMITRMSTPHCARGPKLCNKCAEAAKVKKICLLEIFFESGQMARPTIQIEKDGEKQYVEYDVVKYFKDEAEARDYAKKNKITRINL
jgi:hypothetical protein